MKTILLVLCLIATSASFAQSVFVRPTIFNFGNSIQVQINNNNAFNINCSGTVQAMTTTGRNQTFFYNDYIRGRSFSYRTYWLNSPNERIINTFDFINCYKVN